MADIELVIKIPENYDLSKIQNGSIASKIILNAVANGTPLPTGHGRLIDADMLCEELFKRIEEECKKKYATESLQFYNFGLTDGMKDTVDMIEDYCKDGDTDVT